MALTKKQHNAEKAIYRQLFFEKTRNKVGRKRIGNQSYLRKYKN
ncbi:hypothetical protein L3137_16045 [Bacillus sonorensis]|nr:hypothetical protein [Bacillus sonorensis]MCF7618762.1 hypothetical protein [Bacillus sonorensis]